MNTYLIPKAFWVIQNFEIPNYSYVSIDHPFDYGIKELDNMPNFKVAEYIRPEYEMLYLRIHRIAIEEKIEPIYYVVDTFNSTRLVRNDRDDLESKIRYKLICLYQDVIKQVGGISSEIRSNYEDEVYILPKPFNKPSTTEITVDDVKAEVEDGLLTIKVSDITKYIEKETFKDYKETEISYTKLKEWYL